MIVNATHASLKRKASQNPGLFLLKGLVDL